MRPTYLNAKQNHALQLIGAIELLNLSAHFWRHHAELRFPIKTAGMFYVEFFDGIAQLFRVLLGRNQRNLHNFAGL